MDELNLDLISRRDFIKLSLGSLAALLGARSGILKSERGEAEPKTKLVVIDVFGLDQDSEIGLTRQKLLENTPKNREEAKLLLLKVMEFEYQNHGASVLEVIELMGFRQIDEVEQLSLVTSITKDEVIYDRLGNPHIRFEIPEDEVIKLIRKTDAGVVNMSFEPGKFEVVYLMKGEEVKYPNAPFPHEVSIEINGVKETGYRDDKNEVISKEIYEQMLAKLEEKEIVDLPPEKRYFVFIDGYAGENTVDNLIALTNIAARFPEKIFIAAGGNPIYLEGLRIPDIRSVKDFLKEKGLWPDNLLIVGVEIMENGVTVPASFGADIYVNYQFLENLGVRQSSSFATPVVTEIVGQLLIEHKKDWKAVLLQEMCETKQFFRGDETIEYKVLSFDREKINSGQN